MFLTKRLFFDFRYVGRVPEASVEVAVSDVVYVSKVRIERKVALLRLAYLPGESQPLSSLFTVRLPNIKVDLPNLRNPMPRASTT